MFNFQCTGISKNRKLKCNLSLQLNNEILWISEWKTNKFILLWNDNFQLHKYRISLQIVFWESPYGIFSILIDVRRPILIVGRNIPLARQYKWGKWAFYILQYVNFFLILDSDIMWPATCVFPSWWMIPWIVSWIKSFLPSIMFFRYFYHSIRKIYLGNTH